uniref:Uncharacterized protein n=1 Tax=Tanacetum cinerariifolium TaxID=118510 RepID=A0A6L2L4G3_TANCI|nr:hypothetical protein [Tanacetum cinerariifolium]
MQRLCTFGHNSLSLSILLAGSWRASSRERTPLNLKPRSSPLSAEPPVVKTDRNIYGNAKTREDPLIKKRVDQKKDDPKSPQSVRPAESIVNFKANYKYSMIKKSEEGSYEKLSGLDDPKQFISVDLDSRAEEVGPGSSDKTSAFGDGRDEGFLANSVASNDHGHSRKNWTEKEIKTIRANLYKLASRRYEDLASELRFEESVLRDGVAKYFELEEENQSKDVKNVYEKERRKKLLGKEIEEKKR